MSHTKRQDKVFREKVKAFLNDMKRLNRNRKEVFEMIDEVDMNKSESQLSECQ